MGILISVCKNCLKYGFDINTPSRTRTTPQQISQPNPLKIEHSRNKSKLKQKVLVIWNLLVWLSHLTLHSRVQMLLLRSRMCFVFPCWDFPWNQTWGTVIFDQIHSWTTARPHSRGGIPSLPGSSTEPTEVPFSMNGQRWPRVSDEDAKGALLAQVNKIFTTGMSKEETCWWFYLIPCGFNRDSWGDVVLPFPQKLWLIWKEASHPLVWIITN